MKRIALVLVLVAACKSSDSATPKSEPSPTPTDRAPTARQAPTLPPAVVVGDGSAAAAATGDKPALPERPWHRGGDRMAKMAKMDLDGDGKISDEERAAAWKQRATTMRTRLDANGDGKLTPDELANAQGRMKFDDPASLDTNKDGDISVDELAAAMQARRDAMKAKAAEGATP